MRKEKKDRLANTGVCSNKNISQVIGQQVGLVIIETKNDKKLPVSKLCLGTIDDVVKAFQLGVKEATWRPLGSSAKDIMEEISHGEKKEIE